MQTSTLTASPGLHYQILHMSSPVIHCSSLAVSFTTWSSEISNTNTTFHEYSIVHLKVHSMQNVPVPNFAHNNLVSTSLSAAFIADTPPSNDGSQFFFRLFFLLALFFGAGKSHEIPFSWLLVTSSWKLPCLVLFRHSASAYYYSVIPQGALRSS